MGPDLMGDRVPARMWSPRAELAAMLLMALAASGCECSQGSPPDGGLDASDTGLDGGSARDGGTDGGVAGLSLMTRLAGLWTGPARQTPVGDIPMMNVDFRPVTDRYLFGRVDLGPEDSLRFGFSVETFGEDVLVYRNGGYFRGMLRDMRTKLVEVDESSGRYRFCHVAQGCAYIDALYDFEGPDRLLFDVKVRGAQHVLWNAERKETRPTPSPFPADARSNGPGSAPFPDMPRLSATVHWTEPLSAPADVWLLISTTPCGWTGACTISRSFTVAVDGGTSVSFSIEQIHSGAYHATAVLDRNRNFATARRPDRGDGLALDDPLTIADAGVTTKELDVSTTIP